MNPLKILVVEDEALVATDLSRCLTALDYDVVGLVDTGEAAVRQTLALRPDLVLMDIHLKGPLDGIEAAGQIRTTVHPPPPVVFLTAHADEDTLERAGVSEPFGYVVKPYEARALRAAIEMASYRRHAENRIRKMERWLATTLRSIGDAVLATNAEGRISYLNPMCEVLTGWTLFEALGQPAAQVFRAVRAHDRQPIPDPVQHTVREGISVNMEADTLLIRRDGQETPIDDSAAPIRDDVGHITGAVLVFRDATERRRQEAALRQWNERLEARVIERTSELAIAHEHLSEANRELEGFTHTVAHDLRAPLRAISGYTSLLVERIGDSLDVEARRLLEIVRTNTRRMGEMVDAFLVLAKLGRQKPSYAPTEMEPLIRAVLAELTAQPLQPAPEIVRHPLPPAWGDAALLRQVWANLLSNALKFSQRRHPPRIEIGAREDAAGWTYFVRDNGEGFDMKYAGKLFGPFQRLHRAEDFEGHGIGLATVQSIIRAHGGRIWAEAQPAQGATFFFTLPREAAASARSNTPAPDAAGRQP